VEDRGYQILSGHDFWQRSCVEASNIVSTPTAVVRTSLQQKIGGYRKELPHTGDLEMWLRFAAHASVGVVDAEQAFYRVHGRNMHVETFPAKMTVLQQHRDAFEVLFREYGNRFPDAERLKQMAQKAMALGAVRAAGKQFERGDHSSCESFLQEAVQIYSPVKKENEWGRLRWKRLLGLGLLKVTRRLRAGWRKPGPLPRSPFGLSGVFDGV
jgi:hypothetical protein